MPTALSFYGPSAGFFGNVPDQAVYYLGPGYNLSATSSTVVASFTATAHGLVTISATSSTAVASFTATATGSGIMPASGAATASFVATGTGVALAMGNGIGTVVGTFSASAHASVGVGAAAHVTMTFSATAAGQFIATTFTPPITFELVTNGTDDERPTMSRLMEYYRPRPRGVTVYKMSDGSYRVARDVALLHGPVVEEAWPPVPVADQANNAIATAWIYSRQTVNYTQVPGVEVVYYGGHSYQVSATEAAALVAAGLGRYLT